MDTILTDLLDLDGPQPIPATMSETDLAAFLGVGPSRIRTLARDKVIVRIAPGRFDVAASVLGYCRLISERAKNAGRPSEGGTDYKAEQTRHKRAQADAQEAKNRQLAGELVDASTVTREWQAVLRDVRAAVLAVPSRYGSTAPHLSANDIAALDREIRAALEGLADGND